MTCHEFCAARMALLLVARCAGTSGSEEWGSGQLYINRGVQPYVVVRTRQSFVIVNFKEPERTRGLYESLRRLAQSPKPKAQSLECKSHETTPL